MGPGRILAAALALLCLAAAAQAQERHRTILDMLFGPRRMQPQQYEPYYPPPPQRLRPQKPKRPARIQPPAPRAAPLTAPAPEAPAVEKKPDARRLLVVGDFIGDGLAEGLTAAYAADPSVTVVNRTNGSSGFVRDDFFDWPGSIQKILDEEKPAAVVVMIGANDRQAITLNGKSLEPRSPEWTAEYQRRAGAFVKRVTEGGYPLVWVGEPPFRPKGMSQDMLAFNEIFRTLTGKAQGKFADVWDGFVDEDGNFTQTGFDVNGQTARLRGNDGVNVTSAGKRKLAFYAEKALKDFIGAPAGGPQAEPAAHDASKPAPVDRVNPTAIDDLDRDSSGVLLGGGGAPAEARKPAPQAPSAPGRADDFSWPQSKTAP